MARFLIHYGIHFLIPIAVGFLIFKENRGRAILILLAGILIDADHLFTNPIFDPERCSINFHLLHTYGAIALYVCLLFFKKSRIFGLALLIHIIADAMDCWLLSPEA